MLYLVIYNKIRYLNFHRLMNQLTSIIMIVSDIPITTPEYAWINSLIRSKQPCK